MTQTCIASPFVHKCRLYCWDTRDTQNHRQTAIFRCCMFYYRLQPTLSTYTVAVWTPGLSVRTGVCTRVSRSARALQLPCSMSQFRLST